ncbi:helix-turn-helix domain-containing protein [Candidatus Avoscillospira sp. LCP25S3_F1]|uniref:helix-turn-helix domain-containing protein n=1 Tax=Candidatus Avoscillospira sp. LCP25S3_F1 TaxID=3438825 RepID=UPI003F8E2465
MTLAERIKAQRMAKGYSQEEVAGRLGVSRQAVAKWEGGQSAPSTENLFKLAEVFDTTVDLLLVETPPSQPVPSPRTPPWKRNLGCALGTAGGYVLLYLLWRMVGSDLENTSVLGWLLSTEPGRHSYVYGWLIHNHLYWYAMALSALPSLFGLHRFSLCTFCGFSLGLALGELLGPNPAGAAYGYGHSGWALWGGIFLLSLVAGILSQKWRQPWRSRRMRWLLVACLAAATLWILLVRVSFFDPPVS